jgi:hypothetical protein
MRTSNIGIHKPLAACAQLMSLVGLLLSSPAVADMGVDRPKSRFSYQTS